MTEIVVSRRDGIVTAPDGTKHRVNRGKTLADAEHPLVQAYPNDWQPMHVELAVPGAARNEVEELRNDLAEADEVAEYRGAELQRLADGLAARGVDLAAQGDQTPGWLVTLTLATLDQRAVSATVPPPRAPRAAKPRAGSDD